MKWRQVIAGLLMAAAMPVISPAQQRGHAHDKKEKQSATRYKTINSYYGYSYRNAPPSWAPVQGRKSTHHRVHLPDYHMFYDPVKGGYTYWQNGHWAFSQAAPAFRTKVDIGRAPIRFIGDVPLSTAPENYYDRDMQMYPAGKVNIAIPVPGN